MAISQPSVVIGEVAPYPTGVAVTIAHQKASPIGDRRIVAVFGGVDTECAQADDHDGNQHDVVKPPVLERVTGAFNGNPRDSEHAQSPNEAKKSSCPQKPQPLEVFRPKEWWRTPDDQQVEPCVSNERADIAAQPIYTCRLHIARLRNHTRQPPIPRNYSYCRQAEPWWLSSPPCSAKCSPVRRH